MLTTDCDALAYATLVHAHRMRLCGRRIDWLLTTIYEKCVERYQLKDGAIARNIRAGRATYVAPEPEPGADAAVAAAEAALRSSTSVHYAPNADKKRAAASVEDELKRQTEKLEACRVAGVSEGEIASVLHAANNDLEKKLVSVTHGGAGRRAQKKPSLGVNAEAMPGGSVKRGVGPGKPLRAGQRAPAATPAQDGTQDGASGSGVAPASRPVAAPKLSKASGKAAKVAAAKRKAARANATPAAARTPAMAAASAVAAGIAVMALARDQQAQGSFAPLRE